MNHPVWLAVWLAALCLTSQSVFNETAFAADSSTRAAGSNPIFKKGGQSIGLAGGHGLALPAGGTAHGDLQDLQFIYVAPRWGIGLSDPVAANRWFRGNFELVVEATFLRSFEPSDGIAGGITPLIRYNFLAGDRWVPFVELGGGVLALDFDLRRQADGFNFTPQGGLGMHFFVSERTALTGEWRFHHISNANRRAPNVGINSSVILFGVTFFL